MRGQRLKAAAAPFGIDVFNAIDQAALDAIPTGLCVCTAQGALVRYNRSAVELWGQALPLGDPIQQHDSGFRRYQADGAPIPFAATPVAQVLRSGRPIFGAEVIIEQPDGARVPVLMNVRAAQEQLRSPARCDLRLSGADRTQERGVSAPRP